MYHWSSLSCPVVFAGFVQDVLFLSINITMRHWMYVGLVLFISSLKNTASHLYLQCKLALKMALVLVDFCRAGEWYSHPYLA